MKTWETIDLYLAAFLIAHDFDLSSTRRTDRTIFVFDVEDDFEATLGTWQTTKGIVLGHRYARAIKDLKSLVHRTPGDAT